MDESQYDEAQPPEPAARPSKQALPGALIASNCCGLSHADCQFVVAAGSFHKTPTLPRTANGYEVSASQMQRDSGGVDWDDSCRGSLLRENPETGSFYVPSGSGHSGRSVWSLVSITATPTASPRKLAADFGWLIVHLAPRTTLLPGRYCHRRESRRPHCRSCCHPLTAVRARIQLDVQTPLGGRKKTLTAALLAFVRESADANVINQRTVHAVGVRVNRLLVANGRVAAEEDGDGTAKMRRTPVHSAQVDGVWDGQRRKRIGSI